jgi:hypothetical protein
MKTLRVGILKTRAAAFVVNNLATIGAEALHDISSKVFGCDTSKLAGYELAKFVADKIKVMPAQQALKLLQFKATAELFPKEYTSVPAGMLVIKKNNSGDDVIAFAGGAAEVN